MFSSKRVAFRLRVEREDGKSDHVLQTGLHPSGLKTPGPSSPSINIEVDGFRSCLCTVDSVVVMSAKTWLKMSTSTCIRAKDDSNAPKITARYF